MPRFFFNIHDGVSMSDNEGTELSDWQQARVEAVQLAGAIIKDDAKQIALGEDWRIEVTDEQGLVLFHFHFVAFMAPVLMG